MTTQATSSELKLQDKFPTGPTPWWAHERAKIVGFVAAFVIVLGTLGWWFLIHPYVSTDDARVAMTLIRVAPSGVSGRVEKVNVTEGSQVKRGDVMVELDHRIPQANVDKAQVKYELASRELERQQNLLREGSATRQAFDIARANAAGAQAELELAQVALENTTLRAPFDGIVIQKLAEEGNLLEAGQVAAVVADEDHAWIAANIEETEVADVKVGQPVRISVDEGGTLEGEVIEIRHSVASEFALIPSDNGAGNFTKVVQRVPIKIAIKGSHANLRAGQSVEIKIRVR
jgi:membrane fusion protein (multidrug efflux system)